jgi:hypothetical protein
MLDFIRRLRPRHLFAAWGTWWLILLLQLTPAFIAIWKALNAGTGKGEFGISFDNGVIKLGVSVASQAIYSGSISFLNLVLLVGLPPLAMWLIWVSVRRAPERARERVP